LKLFWPVIGYLCLTNIVTLGAFLWDKRQAKKGNRRVPEAFLLRLSLLGGWPGAKLGQRWFRHKTHKQPFASRLNRIVVLHVSLIVVLCILLQVNV